MSSSLEVIDLSITKSKKLPLSLNRVMLGPCQLFRKLLLSWICPTIFTDRYQTLRYEFRVFASF
ncbi:hypothetical protein ACMD2_25283 [Ananas comosus]|uniref:Uncharacterized protein n=1 Tax=Ananas comosus TaxID=4615 RepID=A0A199UXA5_ANACO|nr:hypothetical protein ACMD2_25283 [Ananas comosus]